MSMIDDTNIKEKNVIIFYHKNHQNQFNGTSVYLKFLIEILSLNYKVSIIEPYSVDSSSDLLNGVNPHYFIKLLKDVYFRQIKWLWEIKSKKKNIPPENTILLVEDIYSAPIPLLLSKIKSYKLVYRAADFGKKYSKSLFSRNRFDTLIYSILRKVLESFLVNISSLIICPSFSIKQEILSRYSDLSNKIIEFPYFVKVPDHFKIHDGNLNTAEPKKKIVNLLFLGDCSYPPNLSAARYIVEEMIPSLNDIKEMFIVTIAGPKTDRLFHSNDPIVRVMGEVSDKEEIMNNSDIGLAPIQTFGGLSMKIVDYLIHGLNVIATPEASFGIIPNEQIIISSFSNFTNVVRNEIIRLVKGNLRSHNVSKEVMDTYMTDKWSSNLLDRFSKIGKN